MHTALRPLALVLVAGVAFAGTIAPPAGVEATFTDGRAKDDVRGVLALADTGLRVEIAIPAGSSLSVKLSPDGSRAPAAQGVAVALCGPDGAEIVVAGTKADRSKDGRDQVTWKKVPIAAFGTHALIVTAAQPGGVRVQVTAKDAKSSFLAVSADGEDLGIGATVQVPFSARSGDKLKFRLAAGKRGSKFAGQAVRVLRPDASAIQFVDGGAKGSLVLDADGDHLLEFTNVGKSAGSWTANVSVAPRKAGKRAGLVSAVQTGLVPRLKRIDPTRGVHLDTAFELTLAGADFQPGMDVRLEKKGREPIIATDVIVTSPSEATCAVDLDTRERDAGVNSVGSWNVVARNAPLFDVPSDPTTIDTTSPLVSRGKKLKLVSSGSVQLPRGVEKGSEVWHVAFTDEFDTDLERMGLSSGDPSTRRELRTLVEHYVVAYLRDLFGGNETNGNVSGSAVAISFVLNDVTRLAGDPGESYSQVLVGGAAAPEDPTDPSEPLPWGFAALDDGNATRDVVTVRTDVLDPRGGNPDASSSWRLAMQPLRDRPLTAIDVAFLTARFDPNQPAQVARFAEIVEQLERASREIAALIAHQIGKSLGLPTAGTGPMAAPTSSGLLWESRTSLAFSSSDLATLRANVVPHALPGKSDALKVAFLPIVDRRPELLPNLTTGQPYAMQWDFVGGRCNAVPSDYRMSFTAGSAVLLGQTLTYDGLSGTAPVCIDLACASISSVYCGVASFAIRVDDSLRNGGSVLFHRLKIVPDINQFPPGHPLRTGVQNCINQVLTAP